MFAGNHAKPEQSENLTTNVRNKPVENFQLFSKKKPTRRNSLNVSSIVSGKFVIGMGILTDPIIPNRGSFLK